MGNREKDVNGINQKIAERLADIVSNHHLKISELSKKTKISSSNLYSILRGDTTPTLYTLSLLCEGLDITPSRFFRGIEVREGNVDSIRDMSLIEKLDELNQTNKQMMAEFAEILLKYQE